MLIVTKSGMNPSLKSWKKLPVKPPMLKTSAGISWWVLHLGVVALMEIVVSVISVMFDMILLSVLRG